KRPFTTQARLEVRHSSCDPPLLMLSHCVTPDRATHTDTPLVGIAGIGPSAQPWSLRHDAALSPPSSVSQTPASADPTTVAMSEFGSPTVRARLCTMPVGARTAGSHVLPPFCEMRSPFVVVR